MKRIMSGLIVCVALLVIGCVNNPFPDDSKNEGGNGSGSGSSDTSGGASDATEKLNSIDTIEKLNANPDYLDGVESFYDAENDYWIFNMGTIENVPLETPTFFYYGGKGEIEQTFTKKTVTVSGVSSAVQKVAQERMAWKLSSEIGASIGLDDVLKASVSSKISGSTEAEKTTTETKSYSEFVEWTNSLEKGVTIRFDERYQAGYYAYLVSATVKVRAVLVKNRANGNVKVGTYNELISKEYSFAYNEFDNKLSVDKNQKFEFNMPSLEGLPAPTDFIDAKGEYTLITSTQGFKDISKNLSGKYMLLNDLDFEGARMTPIGGSSGKFSGVILGNGHTISNFSVSADYPFSGLVARNAGRIENMQICNADISVSRTGADAFAGIIAGENTGTITDCSVSGGSVSVRAVDNNNTENSCRYAVAGGIAGKILGGEIKRCSVEGVSLYGFVKKHDKAWSDGWNEVAFVYIGGIVGEQLGGNVLHNTTASLEIKGEAEYRSNALVTATTRSRICLGGIIGRQADGCTQSKNTSDVSESSFEHSFNSYNEINGVKKIEEYYAEETVGYAD